MRLHLSLMGFDGNIKFRGLNRVEGLALLYFTKDENPQSAFNPPIGTSKITANLKEHETFAIFRTSNWLIIHYEIKNTAIGNLIAHDLMKRYAKNPNNKGNMASFETIEGKLHYNLMFNTKEKRSFPIEKFYGPHEKYGSWTHGAGLANNGVKWTWEYKIISKQTKDQ